MSRVVEGRNSASPSEAASFASEYDRHEKERERRLGELDKEFKKKKRAINKEINADQKKILADGKSQGVQKGVIRALAAEQKDLRKAVQIIEERAPGRLDGLEDDDREMAISIRDAVGDDFIKLPLGAAAAEREESKANGQDETTAAIVDAVTNDEKKGNGADVAETAPVDTV